MNCFDGECKYMAYGLVGDVFDYYCKLSANEIIDEGECQNFRQEHTCLNCKHSITQEYETGTIDDIEYRCTLQQNKLIYDDSNPCNFHYADIPECNIGKWEKEE